MAEDSAFAISILLNKFSQIRGVKPISSSYNIIDINLKLSNFDIDENSLQLDCPS